MATGQGVCLWGVITRLGLDSALAGCPSPSHTSVESGHLLEHFSKSQLCVHPGPAHLGLATESGLETRNRPRLSLDSPKNVCEPAWVCGLAEFSKRCKNYLKKKKKNNLQMILLIYFLKILFFKTTCLNRFCRCGSPKGLSFSLFSPRCVLSKKSPGLLADFFPARWLLVVSVPGRKICLHPLPWGCHMVLGHGVVGGGVSGLSFGG